MLLGVIYVRAMEKKTYSSCNPRKLNNRAGGRGEMIEQEGRRGGFGSENTLLSRIMLKPFPRVEVVRQ